MAGKRILPEHEIESCIQPFSRHLPGDERSFGEIGCDKCLPDAANRSRHQHGANALDDERQLHPGKTGNFTERLPHEAPDLILRDGEDAGVQRIGVLDGYHGQGLQPACNPACWQEAR